MAAAPRLLEQVRTLLGLAADWDEGYASAEIHEETVTRAMAAADDATLPPRPIPWQDVVMFRYDADELVLDEIIGDDRIRFFREYRATGGISMVFLGWPGMNAEELTHDTGPECSEIDWTGFPADE